MKFLDPRAAYRRAQEDVARIPEDPHGIIQFTLHELERSMRVLSASAAEGRALPDTHLSRALTALYILQSSLDFEAGGALADNLFTVYEFARQQVLTGFQPAPSGPGLDRAATLIADIAAAWARIGPQPRAA